MNLTKLTNRHKHPFIKAYQERQKNILDLFSYNNIDDSNYKHRINDIKIMLSSNSNIANRMNIAEVLTKYHEKLAQINDQSAISFDVQKNINAISNGAITIVSGQQAGLFTGPIYTINKIVSLLRMCTDLSGKFNESIIPVFWIAGEDHDIDEVDHLYLNSANNIQKVSAKWRNKPRTSIAEVKLTKEQLINIIDQLKAIMTDSIYKKDILNELYNIYINESISVAFAAVLYKLFSPYGLIFFDSHDNSIRQYEKDVLITIVRESIEISDAIEVGFQNYLKTGHQPQIVSEYNKLGIFVNINGRRCSIHRNNNDKFFIQHANIEITKDDLIQLINDKPYIFSTNVLLRPIMQEFLFQPLVYIGGQAEVMYWAQLQPIFEIFRYKMPIVKLRNSYTFITRNLSLKLQKYEVIDYSIINKESFWKRNILAKTNNNFDIISDFNKLENDMLDIFNEHIDSIPEIFIDRNFVKEISNQKWKKIHEQLNDLQVRIVNEHNKRHEILRSELNWIENEILPLNKLQERVLNIFYFINILGYDFIDNLINYKDNVIEGEHFLVKVES